MNSDQQTAFSDVLIKWYHKHGRLLPWRTTRDPYAIWLSEVILQQTRIQQGEAYYLRFLSQFPTLGKLAAASEDEVLKLWQGLGYYTRARNLHQTAQFIQSANNGVFPSDYESIRNLKGIGDYTAAAISSICFNAPYPVLDGNVYRVMSRVLCLDDAVNSSKGKKIVMKALLHQIDPEQAGDFNQAMMELGAMVCTPRNPDCEHCPLQTHCQAFKRNATEQYPVPAIKKAARIRHFNFLVLEEEQDGRLFTYIQKRESGDIWEGLYEFPLIESNKAMTVKSILKNEQVMAIMLNQDSTMLEPSVDFRHILTHQTLFARFFTIRFRYSGHHNGLQNSLRIPWADISQYPVSRLTEKFLATR